MITAVLGAIALVREYFSRPDAQLAKTEEHARRLRVGARVPRAPLLARARVEASVGGVGVSALETIGTYCAHGADVQLLRTEDFDGYPVGVVLVSGIPVAYVTDPRSNYGDAVPPGGAYGGPEGVFGIQALVAEGDPSQQVCLAILHEFAGEASPGFATLVSELGGLYKALNHIDEHYLEKDCPTLGDGHEWMAFFEDVWERVRR